MRYPIDSKRRVKRRKSARENPLSNSPTKSPRQSDPVPVSDPRSRPISLPANRASKGGAPSQPKTLFQKTRSEASRLSKGVFGSRVTRPAFQTQRIVPNTASAKPPPPSRAAFSVREPTNAQPSGSRVVVRTVPVVQKPPLPSKQAPSVQTKSASALTTTSDAVSTAASPPPTASSPPAPGSPPEMLWTQMPQPQTQSPEARSPPARPVGKKNPGASLFMPKHRAYSQIPRGVQSKS